MQRFFFPFCGLIFTLFIAYLMQKHFEFWWTLTYLFFFCSLCFGYTSGFPGGFSGKEPTRQCRSIKRCRLDPWVRKNPWRRAWQSTPVFLPGESHGQRSHGSHRLWHDWNMKITTHARLCLVTYPNLKSWSFPSSFSSKSSIFVSVCEGLWCICWYVCMFIIPYLKQQQIPTLCRFVPCHWLAFTG